jgi:hypothetical protein
MLSKMSTGRVPLLLLSPSHIQEISADYLPLGSPQISAEANQRVYPIPANGLRHSSFLKLPGHQSLFSLPVPLPRQLSQLANNYSAQLSHTVTLLTKSKAVHFFQFATPTLLFEFLKAAQRVRSTGSLPSDEFTVLSAPTVTNPSPLPCSLSFTAVEDRLVLQWKGLQEPLVSLEVPVDEIEDLTPSTFAPLPTNISIDLTIPNILDPTIRSSTIALVSVTTNSGQSETCLFSCDSNDRRPGKIRFFCRSEELTDQSVLVAVHLQENPAKEIQTIGETEIRLSSLVPLDNGSVEPHSFLSQVPMTIHIPLRAPRCALL